MTSKFKLESPIEFSKRQKRWMLKGFWIALILVVVKIMTTDAPSLSKAGALLIAVMSLLPSYLWCADRAKGLPLFPILTLTYLGSHAFPLVSDNPNVLQYSTSLHFKAAIVVAIFLAVGTITWLRLVKSEPQGKFVIKVFKPKQITPFFLLIIFCTILFDLLQNTGYIWQILPGSMYTALKTGLPSLTSLGLMIIGYQLGAKCLSTQQKIIFIGLLTCLLFQAGAGIYLNIPGVYAILASFGWMLGSGKFPWRLLLIIFLIMSFLNLGKSETRGIYWNKGGIKPGQYTTIYSTWINNSLKQINTDEDSLYKPKQKPENLNERASIIHMLMKAISETGTVREYMNGKTYALIPELLLPRIFNSNKPRGAAATNMLNIYYGRQTYEQTLNTQISWGMLQEAYANFGTIGCAGLGLFLGSFYGYVTRLAMKVPITSYRFLISLAFIMLSVKNELTLSSFLSILSQILILLFVMRLLLMKNMTCYYSPKTYNISH